MSSFVTRGRNIICIGRNYIDHAKELGNAVPKEPFYFLKPTTSYVEAKQGSGTGTVGKIEIPKGVEVHHEVELGVVIGKGGRDISESAAESHIAGYSEYFPLPPPRNVEAPVTDSHFTPAVL